MKEVSTSTTERLMLKDEVVLSKKTSLRWIAHKIKYEMSGRVGVIVIGIDCVYKYEKIDEIITELSPATYGQHYDSTDGKLNYLLQNKRERVILSMDTEESLSREIIATAVQRLRDVGAETTIIFCIKPQRRQITPGASPEEDLEFNVQLDELDCLTPMTDLADYYAEIK